MRKTFKLEDLDCANCAAKMQEAIKKLPEIENANVNFLSQKMVIEAADTVDWSALMKEVVAVCNKVEPDCRILL
jgi:cation transport ATPase